MEAYQALYFRVDANTIKQIPGIKTTTLKVKSFQLIQTTNVLSVHKKIREHAKFHPLHRNIKNIHGYPEKRRKNRNFNS